MVSLTVEFAQKKCFSSGALLHGTGQRGSACFLQVQRCTAAWDWAERLGMLSTRRQLFRVRIFFFFLTQEQVDHYVDAKIRIRDVKLEALIFFSSVDIFRVFAKMYVLRTIFLKNFCLCNAREDVVFRTLFVSYHQLHCGGISMSHI